MLQDMVWTLRSDPLTKLGVCLDQRADSVGRGGVGQYLVTRGMSQEFKLTCILVGSCPSLLTDSLGGAFQTVAKPA